MLKQWHEFERFCADRQPIEFALALEHARIERYAGVNMRASSLAVRVANIPGCAVASYFEDLRLAAEGVGGYGSHGVTEQGKHAVGLKGRDGTEEKYTVSIEGEQYLPD